jgi:hypothetical protein
MSDMLRARDGRTTCFTLNSQGANKFMMRGNMFSYPSHGTFLILETGKADTEVDGLYNTVYWKDPAVYVIRPERPQTAR